jgi:hypothetical protein
MKISTMIFNHINSFAKKGGLSLIIKRFANTSSRPSLDFIKKTLHLFTTVLSLSFSLSLSLLFDVNCLV